MSISDDGTQDLLGPAERDEGIRVHTIHEFAVAHAQCSIGLWILKISSAILGVCILLFSLIL